MNVQPTFDAQAVLSDELMKDERILWGGQPDPDRHFSAADVFLIPFSIMWGGFALFWEAGVLGLWGDSNGEEAPFFFVLWGIPFVFIGLYMMFGRFIYKARKKRRTFYVVTDRRVLSLVRSQRGDKIQAAFIETIPSVNKRIRTDGSGSITFGSSPSWSDWYANTGLEFMAWGWGGVGNTVVFYDVPDARQVAKLVNDLRRRQTGLARNGQ
ncbi:MAG: hypothetical protein ABR505_12345 [Actinomycetota bacterium]